MQETELMEKQQRVVGMQMDECEENRNRAAGEGLDGRNRGVFVPGTATTTVGLAIVAV
jgi:hypothetical protein